MLKRILFITLMCLSYRIFASEIELKQAIRQVDTEVVEMLLEDETLNIGQLNRLIGFANSVLKERYDLWQSSIEIIIKFYAGLFPFMPACAFPDYKNAPESRFLRIGKKVCCYSIAGLAIGPSLVALCGNLGQKIGGGIAGLSYFSFMGSLGSMFIGFHRTFNKRQVLLHEQYDDAEDIKYLLIKKRDDLAAGGNESRF